MKKVIKSSMIVFLLTALLVASVGCDRDLRIYEKDLNAVVDGNKSVVAYPGERVALAEGGDRLLSVESAGLFYTYKNQAQTITGTSHDVELTFADVKPKFEIEDIRFMVIGTMEKELRTKPVEDMPWEEFYAFHDMQVELNVTAFKSKRGKLNFTFEVNEPLPKDISMLVVAVWYDFNYHNIYIPLLVAPDLLDENKELFTEDFDWRAPNNVYVAPGVEVPYEE